MVFVLSVADGGLSACASTEEAEARCDAGDVEKRQWLFFADDGSPLEARFRRPSNGTFVLQRAMSGLWLQERVGQVRSVKGCGLTALAEVVELLKVNRGKRAARGI